MISRWFLFSYLRQFCFVVSNIQNDITINGVPGACDLFVSVLLSFFANQSKCFTPDIDQLQHLIHFRKVFKAILFYFARFENIITSDKIDDTHINA